MERMDVRRREEVQEEGRKRAGRAYRLYETNLYWYPGNIRMPGVVPVVSTLTWCLVVFCYAQFRTDLGSAVFSFTSFIRFSFLFCTLLLFSSFSSFLFLVHILNLVIL